MGLKQVKLCSRGKCRAAVLSALLAPFGISAVHGQEAQDATKLDEIIVTAQRREESLDKVAVSVTAFSQKTMDELHMQSFDDLGSVVPGLVLSTVGPGVAAIQYGHRHSRHIQRRQFSDDGHLYRRDAHCGSAEYRRRLFRQPSPRYIRLGSHRGVARPAGHFVRFRRDGRRHSLHHASAQPAKTPAATPRRNSTIPTAGRRVTRWAWPMALRSSRG